MAANLIARYIWEINTLAKSRHGLTLAELNEKWIDCSLSDGKEIVRKTWFEHRKQIGLQFHIDIECNKHTNRYYIEYEDKLGQPELQEWLLNSFSVGNMLLEGQKLKGRILCEKIPSGYEYLTEIIQAMRNNRIISITYQSFWKNKESKFELMPYALKVFKQRWYLIGGNVAFDGIRIYALDRIHDMEITDEKFKMPKDFDAEDLFYSVYGTTLALDEKAERIEINVYNGQADYFRSLPLHHSQHELSSTPNCTVFEYYLKPTFEFIQEILSHGPDVEVVQPTTLRNTIKSWVDQMGALYKDK